MARMDQPLTSGPITQLGSQEGESSHVAPFLDFYSPQTDPICPMTHDLTGHAIKDSLSFPFKRLLQFKQL